MRQCNELPDGDESTMAIHPSAIVHPNATLGDVSVGPYAVIGADVTLADGVVVGSHAVIDGVTTLGPQCVIHPHAVIGGTPQDLSHDGSRTALVVGRENHFREFSTVHCGSSSGTGTTVIGDNNYFMCGAHVAHDCVVGSHAQFANGATIAGHVTVGDRSVIGGLAGVHQYVHVGKAVMIGAGSICTQDLPHFSIVHGDRAHLVGVNLIGLRRLGVAKERFTEINSAWRALFDGTHPSAIAAANFDSSQGCCEEVLALLEFVRQSKRGIASYRKGSTG
jgi:UDP-N-acetylglucosamine acyltransferase